MPIYVFHCPKCDVTFEEITSYEDRDKVKCEKCGKKPDQLLTTPGAIIFGNPKGTSREDNFDYVARYNYERAQGERRAAEKANQHGDPYNHIDDMPKYEGKIE